MTGTVTQPNWKKLFLQMLVGAIVGAVSAVLLMLVWDIPEPSARMLAVATGMIYALMGLMVAVGAIAPVAGARILNFENAEDLRDQRTILGLSSAACVMIGLLYFSLAAIPAGGTGGTVSREVAAVMVGVCLLVLIVLTILTNRRVDELTRLVSMESSSLAMQASFVIFGGWAALASLGFVPWIEPLAFVSGLALLQLLAIFWVSGKRGLLVPGKTN